VFGKIFFINFVVCAYIARCENEKLVIRCTRYKGGYVVKLSYCANLLAL